MLKFTAVIGNPPYQELDGGAGSSAKPVYNHFVNVAKSANPDYISMIMPAKWFTDGKGLDKFREEMFNDPKLSKIYDFVNSRDCFQTVDIAGGVCYFLWGPNSNALCSFTTINGENRSTTVRNLAESESFIRHSDAIEIVEKVKKKCNIFYNQKVSSRKPFGLATNARPMSDGDLTLKYNGGIGPFDSNIITNGKHIIDKWNVICSYLTAEHAGQTDKEGRKKILSSLDILEPNEICTETYLVLDSFDTEQEARHMHSYVRTQFVRFLIAQLAATQHLSKEKFSLVPLQEFTENSDIDWSKDVAEIDRQLYAKYGLGEEEIAFIECMIKPM